MSFVKRTEKNPKKMTILTPETRENKRGNKTDDSIKRKISTET